MIAHTLEFALEPESEKNYDRWRCRGGLRWEESGEAAVNEMPAFNVLFSSPPI